MEIELWRRLAESLDEVLELAPDAQARHLGALRETDPELAELLEKALRADADGIAHIDSPLMVQLPSPAQDGQADPLVERGARLGPWRLIRELGQGGMGRVWLAERDDGQYRHQVAVKFIEGMLDSPLSRLQLTAERQILADLDHPNIARLLDGGVRDDGTPWYAMEFIEGQAIDVHCQQHEVGLRGRLNLLVTVARAVHYAHTRLVVHRDLKPGNILVDQAGSPHLLDFGIAKLLQTGDDAPGALTLLGAATPEYAAPEQIQGRATTTSTDIFALGVIAHELITDRRPSVERGQSVPKWQLGPLPSASLRTRRRRAPVRGDIDSIVAQALAPEPSMRYASAEALADDIERHLNGLPVQARRAGAAYRAQKFLRRHWLAVGLGTMAVIGLCVALVWSTIQTQRAETALVRANAVQSFLIEVFDAAQPAPGGRGVVTQRELAERAIERLDRVLEDQPEIAADLQIAVGRVFGRLGFPDWALASLARAEVLLDVEVTGDADPRRVLLRKLQGEASLQQGDARSAVGFLEQALGLAEMQRSPDWLQAEILKELGLAFSNLRETEQAIEVLDRAEQLALQSARGAASLPRIQIVRALNLRRAGRLSEALATGQRAVESARLEYGSQDNRLASALSTVGGMHRRVGRLDEAERMLREALSIELDTYGQANPATVNNLANVLLRQGRLEAARESYHLAVVLAAEQFGPDTPRAASYRRNLARFQLELGEIEPALDSMRLAESLYASAYEADNLSLMNLRNDLAWALLEAGLPAEAEEVLLEVTSRIEPTPGRNDQVWRRAHLLSARRALQTLDFPVAAQHLAIAERELAQYDLEFDDRIRLELIAGEIDLASGRPDQALARWRAAEAMAHEQLGTGHPLRMQIRQRAELSATSPDSG